MTSEVQHGTRSGYVYHYNRWKTPVCEPCRQAHREATREFVLAQNAARSRLIKMYPTVWRALLDEEKFKRGL